MRTHAHAPMHMHPCAMHIHMLDVWMCMCMCTPAHLQMRIHHVTLQPPPVHGVAMVWPSQLFGPVNYTFIFGIHNF